MQRTHFLKKTDVTVTYATEGDKREDRRWGEGGDQGAEGRASGADLWHVRQNWERRARIVARLPTSECDTKEENASTQNRHSVA